MNEGLIKFKEEMKQKVKEDNNTNIQEIKKRALISEVNKQL